MEKLNLRIAFDFIDQNGEVIHVSDYANGFIIPLAVEKASEIDHYMIGNKLINNISGSVIDKSLSHLFFQPPASLQEERHSTEMYKSQERFFEYYLDHIELQDLHNTGLQNDQTEGQHPHKSDV